MPSVLDEITTDARKADISWQPTGRAMRAQITVRVRGELLANESVDLSSDAKRQRAAEDLAARCNLDVDELAAELLRISGERCSQAEADDTEADDTNPFLLAAAALDEMPEAVIADADDMLRAPDLLDRLAIDLQDAGIAGERELALLTYVVGTSRMLDKPVSLITQGPSSSGKSWVSQIAAELFPPEAKLVVTKTTSEALFYAAPGSLRHRWVVAGERSRKQDDDTAEATRALREMLSSGRLSKLVTTKRDGELVSVLVEQDGPISWTESTTLSNIFDEDRNRCLLLQTDETVAQTKRIMQAAAKEAAGKTNGKKDAITNRHHALQRLLQPHKVIVPFAERLADLLAPMTLALESRRAFPQILQTIRAVALLHQKQRQVDHDGRLVAELRDYEIAAELLAVPIGQSIGDALSAPTRRFLDRLSVMTGDENDPLPATFTARDVRKRHRSARSSINGWLSELADRGHVELVDPPEGARRAGRPPAYYRLTDHPIAADDLLPPASALGDFAEQIEITRK